MSAADRNDRSQCDARDRRALEAADASTDADHGFAIAIE
jgi:hypothetical protein